MFADVQTRDGFAATMARCNATRRVQPHRASAALAVAHAQEHDLAILAAKDRHRWAWARRARLVLCAGSQVIESRLGHQDLIALRRDRIPGTDTNAPRMRGIGRHFH